MCIDICNRANRGRRRGGQVFGSSSVSVPELFGDRTVIPVLGESWRGVKLWKMGQLVTITFCRETFHYSIPLISAVSKEDLGLFPMKDFPYIFALFSTLYLYLFVLPPAMDAPAVPSSWVLCPLAVPLVASAAAWLMCPVSDGETSRAHPFSTLKHSFSQ